MEAETMSPVMKKAVLITGREVKIPESFKPPFRLSRSTAGPGAGSPSMVLTFGDMRVKKSVSRHEGEFELIEESGAYKLLRNGEDFISDVDIQPTIAHSPEQAFFNLEHRCMYDCKFCKSARLERHLTKDLSPEKIVEMALKYSEREDFQGVALTSAVSESPSETVLKMAHIVCRLREELGLEVPIGVEPYVSSREDIDRLKAAGADEIKINIETYDQEIFDKVCGKMDYEWILEAIEYAGKVFGKGSVASNIIYGLGETDDNIIEGVEHLAKLGCVATLRALRLDEVNRETLEEALGPLKPVGPHRMIELAKRQKDVFLLYDLRPDDFKTMCHLCTCCDIVPFRDI